MDVSQILAMNKNNSVINQFIQLWQSHLVQNDLNDEQAIEVVENLNKLVHREFLFFTYDEGGASCTVHLETLYDKLHHLYLRNCTNMEVKKCFNNFIEEFQDFYRNDVRSDLVRTGFYSYRNIYSDEAVIDNFFLNYNYPRHPIIEFYEQFYNYLSKLRRGEDILEEFSCFYHSSGLVLKDKQNLDWPELLPENYSQEMKKNLNSIYDRQLAILTEKISIEATLYFIEQRHEETTFSGNIISLLSLMSKTDSLSSLMNNFKQEHIDMLLQYKSTDEYSKFIEKAFYLDVERSTSLEALAAKGKFFDQLFSDLFIDKGFNGIYTVNSLSQYWNISKPVVQNKNESLEDWKKINTFTEQLIKKNMYYALHDGLEEKRERVQKIKI